MEEEMDDVVVVNDGTNDDSLQSPLEALRARRQEIAERRTTLIPIAGFEGLGLHAKYRLTERPETDAIAKKVRSQTKDRNEAMFLVMVDTMIAALEGFILMPTGVTEEQASNLQDMEGVDIKSFSQLAATLGANSSVSGRERTSAAYVFADNESALGTHAMFLQRWLNNTAIDVDMEFFSAEG